MPGARGLRNEFIRYLQDNGIDYALYGRFGVLLDPVETASVYFNTGMTVIFANDSTVSIRTTGNVKLASPAVRQSALAAIAQQNREDELTRYMLDDNDCIVGETVDRVEPGAVGERCWMDVAQFSRDVEGFLLGIEDLLDQESYAMHLSSDDQAELEELARKITGEGL